MSTKGKTIGLFFAVAVFIKTLAGNFANNKVGTVVFASVPLLAVKDSSIGDVVSESVSQ